MKKLKVAEKMFEFTLTGNIPSKKNKWAISKYGGMYRPKDFNEWEEDAIKQLKSQKMPKMAGEFKVRLQFYCSSKKGDLDGKITSICDLLQASGAIDNDGHILELEAYRLTDKKRSRVIGQVILLE